MIEQPDLPADELAELRETLIGSHRPVQRPDVRQRWLEFHQTRPEYFHKRSPEDKGLSVKWSTIISMQMRGLTGREIAERLGMSETTISNIIRTPRYREHFQKRIEGYDTELLALKPKAIAALETALSSQSEELGLRAAKEFFAVTGTGAYGKSQGSAAGTSAEDLARALLIAAKQEVHVHIGANARPLSGVEIQDGYDASAGAGRGGGGSIGVGSPSSRGGMQGSSSGNSGGDGLTSRDDGTEPRRLEGDSSRSAQEQRHSSPLGERTANINPAVDPRLSRQSNLRESLA